jgi:catechol 2,3-dioxygenase-like lactoylglutathione lyase family enzyme
MGHIDHAGICPADLDASLRFYRDGLGLEVIFDVVLEQDLEDLLGVTTAKVRTVFLGNPQDRGAAAVELIDLGTGTVAGTAAPVGLPRRGVFLISFVLPVEATLARLAGMGLGGPPRKVPTPSGHWAATVVDPDGTVVELLDRPVSLG